MSSRGRSRPQRPRRALLAGVLLFVANDVAATEPVVEYWTIEANEGQSAGGHAAIRIGDVVHHLEHRGDGLIQDRRDPRARFEAAYRGRGNRGIQALQLDVSPSERRRLSARLRSRAIGRDLSLDALERLEETARWLAQTRESATVEIAVPGLGLFGPPARAGCAPGTARARLRALAASPYRQARSSRRRTLDLIVRPRPTTDESGAAYRDLLEAVQLEAALGVMASCRSVRPERLSRLDDDASSIDAASNAWIEIRDTLAADLTRLIGSDRSDRGLALLLGWARLEAVERSISSGRAYLVDSFEERASDQPIEITLPDAWQAARVDDLAARTAKARRALRDWRVEDGGLEPLLDRLERTTHDLRHARTFTRHDRGQPLGALEASRALERATAVVPLVWSSNVTLRDVERASRAADARATALRRSLDQRVGYDLVRRNCVTELLQVLEAEGLAHGASSAPLTFAPIAAHAAITRTSNVASHRAEPGARRGAIERAASQTTSVADRFSLRLRESNTLTSRLYRPHADDSSFLFFASDAPGPVRPLIGALNLAWGTGALTAGIAAAPFDGGELFGRGLRGAVMSVPELFFVAIRKGSYAEAPPPSVMDGS